MVIRGFLALLCCLLASPAWAFPDNGVLETFTGTDNTSPPNANWTNTVIQGASSALIRIRSNAAASSDNVATGDAYYNVTQFAANVEAYADVTDVVSTASGGVYVRMKDLGVNTADGYSVNWDDGATSVFIIRWDNGAVTVLDTFTLTPAAGDKFGIRAVGSTICAWYKVGAADWGELGCVEDATYPAGGYSAIAVNGANTVGGLDNFGGGNVATSRRPIPPIFFQ